MNDTFLTLADFARQWAGLVLPPVIDFINKNISNSQARFFISVVFCAVVAFVLNIDKLVFGQADSLLASFALIFTQAQVVYKLYWENSRVRSNLLYK